MKRDILGGHSAFSLKLPRWNPFCQFECRQEVTFRYRRLPIELPLLSNGDDTSKWMAEAGEPIAMAAGSALRAAGISLGTVSRRNQMYAIATAGNLDSAWFVNHIEAD